MEVGEIMGKDQVRKAEVGTKELARIPLVVEVGEIMEKHLVLLLIKMVAGKVQVQL